MFAGLPHIHVDYERCNCGTCTGYWIYQIAVPVEHWEVGTELSIDDETLADLTMRRRVIEIEIIPRVQEQVARFC